MPGRKPLAIAAIVLAFAMLICVILFFVTFGYLSNFRGYPEPAKLLFQPYPFFGSAALVALCAVLGISLLTAALGKANPVLVAVFGAGVIITAIPTVIACFPMFRIFFWIHAFYGTITMAAGGISILAGTASCILALKLYRNRAIGLQMAETSTLSSNRE